MWSHISFVVSAKDINSTHWLNHSQKNNDVVDNPYFTNKWIDKVNSEQEKCI